MDGSRDPTSENLSSPLPMEPIVPNSLDLNVVELCKNLLFASQYKQCNTTSELLQKVVELKCIQESTMLKTLNLLNVEQSSSNPSCSSSVAPIQLPASFLSAFFGFPLILPENEMELEEPEPIAHADSPVFFNSLTAVLKNLLDAGVDPIVADNIALDRLTSPSANPLSFMSKTLLNGRPMFPLDEVTMFFIKSVLKRLHNHEHFTTDGAPYPFDVKSALRYSEHLHSQIPDLRTINPPHVAHEQSITIAAMARFMAMHEIVSNIDLRLIFPVETNVLEEHAYYSAFFWTYREAFKNFHYPSMPPPLPPHFQLTAAERKILNRYWNGGNRHVTLTEAEILAKRCPSLKAHQVYAYFDRRRRQEHNKYRFLKDAETLAKETTHMGKKLREIKKAVGDESDEDDDVLLIQREFLSKADRAKLQTLWRIGHRKPSRNECELMAADEDMKSADQIYAYFEDRRWRAEYQQRKLKVSSSKKK